MDEKPIIAQVSIKDSKKTKPKLGFQKPKLQIDISDINEENKQTVENPDQPDIDSYRERS